MHVARRIVGMTDPGEVDDAIDTALERTRTNQAEVHRTLERDEVPRPSVTDDIVDRADDLNVLTHEAGAPTTDLGTSSRS